MASSALKARWLFKEEPAHYNYDQLVADGKTIWDGVENNLALKYLRSVRKGDEILFYHTGDERSVVGIMKATSDAYGDPKTKDSKLVVVNVEPVRKLRRPVTLAEMKPDPKFAGFDLLRISRLSVMPVPDGIWTEILNRSEK